MRAPPRYERKVANANLVDVSHCIPKGFRGMKLAIEATVFDRYVLWPRAAMETHGLALDEGNRLRNLIEAAAIPSLHPKGGAFVAKVIDATAGSDQGRRVVFELRSVDAGQQTGWVITTTQ